MSNDVDRGRPGPWYDPRVTSPEIAAPAAGATPAEPAHPAPTRTLSRHARTQWVLAALAWALPLLLASIAVQVGFESWDGPAWVRATLVPVAAVLAIVGAGVIPHLRWRHWRYEVRAEEIDLRRGAITTVRTIVPMARVQHVETRRTFLSQVFQTATLVLHTAAGAVTIPLLDDPVAAALRDQIAELARMPDDDDRT